MIPLTLSGPKKRFRSWKKRSFVHDAPMGPKQPRSTVLTPEQEAACVTFRKYTLYIRSVSLLSDGDH